MSKMTIEIGQLVQLSDEVHHTAHAVRALWLALTSETAAVVEGEDGEAVTWLAAKADSEARALVEHVEAMVKAARETPPLSAK